MFTGIIKGTGIIVQTEPELVIEVDSDLAAEIEIKSHIAVNGRASRVLSKDVDFDRQVSRLKFYNSNLNQARNYSHQEQVNLEPAVRLGEEIPGTFFYGIPTGLVKLVSRELLSDGNLLMHVLFDNNLVDYLSVKDCICLDGVFLQIIHIDNHLLTFNIYASSLKNTSLRSQKSELSIEIDPFTLKIANIMQKFNR